LRLFDFSKIKIRNKETLLTFTILQTFSGVLFDIFLELHLKLNFSYTMVRSKEMKYGNLNETNGKWNGIIGMLQRKEVDFTIMDLTILAERSQVKFTVFSFTLKQKSNYYCSQRSIMLNVVVFWLSRLLFCFFRLLITVQQL
jgi:hypothetical protein